MSAAMAGHFKVNGVGTLWLPGDDEVMAKEVCAVMIVWELCVCWLLKRTIVLTQGKSIK